MRQEYQHAAEIDILGQVLQDMMAQNAVAWDECLCRLAMPTPASSHFSMVYRLGRQLFCVALQDDQNVDALVSGIAALLKRLPVHGPATPTVGVLSVQPGGNCWLLTDTNPNSMEIGLLHIGLRDGYFSRSQIDPPEGLRAELDDRAKWEALLADGITFKLSFVASDFGYPCPDDLRAVKDALDRDLQTSGTGKVPAVEFEDAEDKSYERLHIGVIEIEAGARRIAALMRSLRAPASTTLHLVGAGTETVDMGLKPKADLVIEHATFLAQELVRESMRCAPDSWQEGMLTIRTNGDRIDYALKNAASTTRATLSPALVQLCEDFSVIMWLKGDKWTRAAVRYVRTNGSVDFDIDFSYDTADGPPEATPPGSAPARPWWKRW
jgi:hypothetical protein